VAGQQILGNAWPTSVLAGWTNDLARSKSYSSGEVDHASLVLLGPPIFLSGRGDAFSASAIRNKVGAIGGEPIDKTGYKALIGSFRTGKRAIGGWQMWDSWGLDA
jgi:hypothetical protein